MENVETCENEKFSIEIKVCTESIAASALNRSVKASIVEVNVGNQFCEGNWLRGVGEVPAEQFGVGSARHVACAGAQVMVATASSRAKMETS